MTVVCLLIVCSDGRCRCVYLVIVCPDGRWNGRLEVLCSLTAGNPKSVDSVYMSVVKCRSECVRLVAKLVLSLLVTTFSPLPHLPSYVLVESLLVLFGCIPSPVSHSKS